MENMLTPADVAAVTRNNGNGMFGDGAGSGGFWIFALLILFGMMGNGNGLFGNRGNCVTEADLCNANSFNELKSSVGRLNDQLAGVNINLTKGICDLGYTIAQQFNSIERQVAECCCSLKQEISQVRFDMANFFAQSEANTTAKIQKVLDKMCDQEKAQMAARINQLELQQALYGVVRYPNGYMYSAGNNPFCGQPQTCCGNGNGNY